MANAATNKLIKMDSLNTISDTKKITQIEMQYEFDKKEATTKAEQENTTLEIKEGSKLKRLFDLIFGLLILGISPLLVLFQKNKWQFIQNVFSVIFGWKTWVGFAPVESQKLAIDKSKPSILFLGMAYSPSDYSEGFFENLNLEYCKKYYFWNDIPIILSNWKNLDN